MITQALIAGFMTADVARWCFVLPARWNYHTDSLSRMMILPSRPATAQPQRER